MELNQLRAFIAVLDSGSLLNGSKLLQVSRTTVHTWIDALEQSLQMELLVRTPRGVEATEFGRHFAIGARALLENADTLVRAAEREREEVLGELRMRFSVGLPPKLMTHFPARFHQRHPHIALRIEVTSEPTKDVPSDIDFVMHFGPMVPSGPFRTFTLARFTERLLASKRYLDTHGRPRTLADLSKHRLLSWCPPGEDGRRWPLRDGGTLEVEPLLVLNDAYPLHLMVGTGQGIVYVPDAGTRNGPVPRKEIELVLPRLVGRDSSLYVLVPETHAATPRGRVAIGLLRDLIKDLLDEDIDSCTAPQPSAAVT